MNKTFFSSILTVLTGLIHAVAVDPLTKETLLGHVAGAADTLEKAGEAIAASVPGVTQADHVQGAVTAAQDAMTATTAVAEAVAQATSAPVGPSADEVAAAVGAGLQAVVPTLAQIIASALAPKPAS